MHDLPQVDIDEGRDLVLLLDETGLPVKGAYWLWETQHRQWRLFIISADARDGLGECYRRAGEAGARLDLTRVDFKTPDDPLFRVLSRAVRAEGICDMRMTDSLFNNIHIEDLLVYRLAA